MFELDLKGWILIFACMIILLMLVSRSFIRPLQWMGYALLYSAVGAIVLFLLNLAGQHFQLEIPINPFTALIVGGLGFPGIAYLVTAQLFIF